MLLPGASLEQARQRAEECRAACGAVTLRTPEGPVSRTISAGVAALGPDTASSAALLDAADRALYAAKHAGRDRVATHGCTTVQPGDGAESGDRVSTGTATA